MQASPSKGGGGEGRGEAHIILGGTGGTYEAA